MGEFWEYREVVRLKVRRKLGVLHSLCTCSEERRSRGLTGPIPCCAALERPCSGTRPPAVVGTSRRSLKSKQPT